MWRWPIKPSRWITLSRKRFVGALGYRNSNKPKKSNKKSTRSSQIKKVVINDKCHRGTRTSKERTAELRDSEYCNKKEKKKYRRKALSRVAECRPTSTTDDADATCHDVAAVAPHSYEHATKLIHSPMT
jgi:hypothetical protein